MYKKKFLMNFPFGVFSGAIVALLLCAMLDAEVRDDLSKFYTFIFSAMIGLLAASVALLGALANLEQQRIQREQDRARELLSARSFLPIALSEMCEVAKMGARNSWADRPNAHIEDREAFYRQSLEDIRLSDEIVSVFRSIIRLSSDDGAAARIQGILREYQVFSARWRSHVTDQNNLVQPDLSDVAQRTTAWAFLYALTSTAFDYARGVSNTVDNSISEDQISSALMTANCPSSHIDEFNQAIGLYARHFTRRF